MTIKTLTITAMILLAAAAFADAATVRAVVDRNRATVGGNLANASPGAEFSVPLMALDAEVEVTLRSGFRV